MTHSNSGIYDASVANFESFDGFPDLGDFAYDLMAGSKLYSA